jgi:hypothetical protein
MQPDNALSPLGERLFLGTFGAVALIALASIFNWIAFDPGPRHFTSTLSLAGSPVQRESTGETGGRVIFGVIALLLDLLVIVVAVRWMRVRKHE